MNTQARRFHVIALRRSARGIAPHLRYDEWLVGCQFRDSLSRVGKGKRERTEDKLKARAVMDWATAPRATS